MSEMQFVHGLRRSSALRPGGLHPLLVAPFIREVPDYRGCPWRTSHRNARVALVDRIALVLRYDVILVQSTGGRTQETPPDADESARASRRCDCGFQPLNSPTTETEAAFEPRRQSGCLFAGSRRGSDGHPAFRRTGSAAFAEEVDVLFR